MGIFFRLCPPGPDLDQEECALSVLIPEYYGHIIKCGVGRARAGPGPDLYDAKRQNNILNFSAL